MFQRQINTAWVDGASAVVLPAQLAPVRLLLVFTEYTVDPLSVERLVPFLRFKFGGVQEIARCHGQAMVAAYPVYYVTFGHQLENSGDGDATAGIVATAPLPEGIIITPQVSVEMEILGGTTSDVPGPVVSWLIEDVL